jgi:hypothetical protein
MAGELSRFHCGFCNTRLGCVPPADDPDLLRNCVYRSLISNTKIPLRATGINGCEKRVILSTDRYR